MSVRINIGVDAESYVSNLAKCGATLGYHVKLGL